MKKNLVPLLGIAFVVAIVATGLFYGLLMGRLRTSSTSDRTIVVAARTIDRGTEVVKDAVKTVAWSAADLPKGAVSGVDAAIGATALETIQEGEPLLESRIGSRKAGAAGSVPPGMRAITVHVADSGGVVSMLRPGHRVDVQVIAGKNGVAGADPQLRPLLHNIEVLGTGQAENGRPVVNLLTRPEDADSLALADTTARVRLVLRNPLDEDSSGRPTVGLAGLMSAPSPKPAPKNAPAAPLRSSAAPAGGSPPASSSVQARR